MLLHGLGVCAFAAAGVAAATKEAFNLQPFTVNLSTEAVRMIELVKLTRLPEEPEYPGVGSSYGIDLDVLKTLQHEWLTEFSWEKEQAAINEFAHFTASIEGLTIHFIHEQSPSSAAIPLILLHGWPGSFLEFFPIIKSLTTPAKTTTGKAVAFHVVAFSLPGFAFSSAPPEGWTHQDTARIVHTLMTQVLGYETFAVHGTDMGGPIGFTLYERYSSAVRAAHFHILPFFPPTPDQFPGMNISITPLEEFEMQRFVGWITAGSGYYYVSMSKPNTIGLALQDNPVGQLAWIGEKYIDWSDPSAGTPPSKLTHNEILKAVSIYFLTKSFTSSVYAYAQNPAAFSTNYTRATSDAPLLFTNFKYNIVSFPEGFVKQLANLARYRNHEFGGHFPGLDNPEALLEDLREIGSYWVPSGAKFDAAGSGGESSHDEL